MRTIAYRTNTRQLWWVEVVPTSMIGSSMTLLIIFCVQLRKWLEVPTELQPALLVSHPANGPRTVLFRGTDLPIIRDNLPVPISENEVPQQSQRFKKPTKAATLAQPMLPLLVTELSLRAATELWWIRNISWGKELCSTQRIGRPQWKQERTGFIQALLNNVASLLMSIRVKQWTIRSMTGIKATLAFSTCDFCTSSINAYHTKMHFENIACR